MRRATVALTGVGHGLGRALARRFDALGHDVAGCTLGAREVEELEAELPRGLWRRADVRKPHEVERWADDLLSAIGPPDLVVCCAGTIHRESTTWRIEPDELTSVLRTNVEGPVHVAGALLPAMSTRASGVFVIISSGMAQNPRRGFGPYAASKAAVETLVASLAQDLPHALAAVALRPGLIRTRMLESVLGDDEIEVYPPPEVWAHDAAPFLLGLGPEDSGRTLALPGWG